MSYVKYIKPLIIPASKSPSSGTLIFLHGLGDSGYGWADAMEFISNKLPDLKIILPNAPNIPITCNGGMVMPGWYDIVELGNRTDDDIDGLEQTKKYVLDLINSEIDSGVPSNKIILGGFSQGAAVSYYTAYSIDVKLAGTVCLSGYLPAHQSFAKRMDKTNLDTPLFAAHGTVDQVVAFKDGQDSFNVVTKSGIKGNFMPIKGMGHSVDPTELVALGSFISDVLKENKL